MERPVVAGPGWFCVLTTTFDMDSLGAGVTGFGLQVAVLDLAARNPQPVTHYFKSCPIIASIWARAVR